MSLVLLLGTGLLLGAMHAFEPDHLAAVSSFVSKKKTSSLRYGFVWGLGHTTSLFIATILALLLKLTFPSWFFELLVGVVLIVLGLRLLLKKEIGNTKHQFAIGLLHGLAGTAALIVLIASTTTTFLQSILFILLFGIGSLIGMSLVSISLGVILQKYTKLLSTSFNIFIAIISIGIGLYKLISIAFL